jgi:prephenate dehydrogenase
MRVAVIGTGLIGTSIALALREQGVGVWLADSDPAAARLAADLGAGEPLPQTPDARADVAVIAVPPAAVAATLAALQARGTAGSTGLARCYTDVASVKQLPVAQARALGCDMTSYVPGHPLAGREKHGPAAARADLFLGRTWALCPAPETSAAATETVTELVLACGAVPMRTEAAAHDRWVALISHAPHLVAAAMAARLEAAPHEALELAGQGLRDVTRIAAGDAGLWTQILAANAAHAASLLPAIAEDLTAAAAALARIAEGDEESLKRLTDLLERGGAGTARIPGKQGGPPPAYAEVQVVIGDQPGELARVFQAAGDAGINIEDVRIEHSPGRPAGALNLSVSPEAVVRLTEALAAGGWPVRR